MKFQYHVLLFEAPTKTKVDTKTRTSVDPSIDNLLRQKQKHLPDVSKQTGRVAPSKKMAGATKTKQKTKNIDIGPQGMRHMMDLTGNLDKIDVSQEPDIDIDIDQDTAGYEPVETTPENLPAVINKEIMAETDVEPEWHMVKDLPGYLSKPIRAMGRQLFSAFTDTKLEEVNVLANLMDQGPNEAIELNVVSAYLKKHGVRMKEAEISFEEIMPDYQAEVVIYAAEGYVFMLVRDFAGRYIYSWPVSDNLLPN